MKNTLKLWAAACCLVFLSAGLIFAQEKKITAAEMTAVQNKAKEKLNGQRYRVRMTSGVYQNPNSKTPSWSGKTITEYAPEGIHSITEANDNGQRSRRETITLGERRFVKTNDEAWKELSSGQEGGGGFVNMGTTVPVSKEDKSIEYKYLGKKSVDNREAEVYQIKTRLNIASNFTTGVSVSTERFWYDADNRLIKTERESRFNDKPVQDMVLLYEYDPTIKIEAPVK